MRSLAREAPNLGFSGLCVLALVLGAGAGLARESSGLCEPWSVLRGQPDSHYANDLHIHVALRFGSGGSHPSLRPCGTVGPNPAGIGCFERVPIGSDQQPAPPEAATPFPVYSHEHRAGSASVAGCAAVS